VKLAQAPMMSTPGGWSICRRAPAKVNLTLRVVGRRSDGFHAVESLVVGVGLTDELRFADAGPGEISVSCSDTGVPSDDRNLVVRAARLLADRTGTTRGARISLTKAIPIGAGLGGGSSDAAVTLRALNDLWGTGWSDSALADLGAEIGSDVPLFFHLPSARVRGRGEVVEPWPLTWCGWVMLWFGGVCVSTKEVYAAWDRLFRPEPTGGAAGVGPDRSEDAPTTIARSSRAECVRPHLFNDLEPAVFHVAPAVRALFDRACELGAPQPRISGAGSTIYTLHDTQEEALALADTLRKNGLGTATAVVRTLSSNDVTISP
jgi:4-diphosphocytidyl-2-C-methyl-D-erythritol kinase